MMGEIEPVLPDGWVEVSLSDLGTWTGGGTPSKRNGSFWDGEIPWLSPKDMKSSRPSDTQDHISAVALEESAAKLFPGGSIAFVVRSGILEHTLPLALIDYPATANQDMRVLTPASPINPEWLLYALLGAAEQIRRSCRKDGTTVASLEVPKLQRFRIGLPPRSEQDRIVAAARSAMSAVDAAERSLDEAEALIELVPASFIDATIWGSRPVDASWAEQLANEREREWKALRERGALRGSYKSPTVAIGSQDFPSGSHLLSLDQACIFITDGDHNPPPRTSSGVPHLTAKHVRNGGLDSSGATHIAERDYERVRKRYEPQEGDVIVTCVGTIGKVGVVPPSFRFSPDRNLAGLRPLPSVSPQYLAYALRGFRLQQTMRRASGSTAQPHLYLGDLRSLPVPVPPRSEQDRIVTYLDAHLDAQRGLGDATEAARVGLGQLRQSILHHAFSGQLLPQDPTDEPASVLLERIEAQKAARETGVKEQQKAKRLNGGSRTPRRAGRA